MNALPTKCYDMTNGWCEMVLLNAPFYLHELKTSPFPFFNEATAHKTELWAVGRGNAPLQIQIRSLSVWINELTLTDVVEERAYGWFCGKKNTKTTQTRFATEGHMGLEVSV